MDMFLRASAFETRKVRFHIVAFDFFEDLVRAVLVFILKIEDGIDEVFVLQKAEAILQRKPVNTVLSWKVVWPSR